MGVFILEALRITHLFPRIANLGDHVRRRIFWIALTLLVTLAGVEAALALMRDMLIADKQALLQSLATVAQPAVTDGWVGRIPTAGQMLLGFMLPFALAFIAIPLESLIHSARSVRGALARPSGVGVPSDPEHGKLRVELRVEKVAGTLRVTADLRRATGLWQRVRKVPSRSLLHGFVEAPIDAELRALIPPPPLVVSHVLKVKAPERGIVALACGELGSEGGQELALVSREVRRKVK